MCVEGGFAIEVGYRNGIQIQYKIRERQMSSAHSNALYENINRPDIVFRVDQLCRAEFQPRKIGTIMKVKLDLIVRNTDQRRNPLECSYGCRM